MKKVIGVILALFLVIVPVMAVTADAAELDDLSAARKGAEVFEAWYIQKYEGYDFLMNRLHSPAKIVVDLKKDDPTWNAALATWRVATFDLKSEWDLCANFLALLPIGIVLNYYFHMKKTVDARDNYLKGEIPEEQILKTFHVN